MKIIYSGFFIVIGLAILYLSIRNEPQNWFSTLLLFILVAVSVFLFFYYQKKHKLKSK